MHTGILTYAGNRHKRFMNWTDTYTYVYDLQNVDNSIHWESIVQNDTNVCIIPIEGPRFTLRCFSIPAKKFLPRSGNEMGSNVIFGVNSPYVGTFHFFIHFQRHGIYTKKKFSNNSVQVHERAPF